MRRMMNCLLVAGFVVIRAGTGLNAEVSSKDGGQSDPQFASPQAEDRLNFVNNDRIHGLLVSALTGTGRLTWKHAAAQDYLVFDVASLAQIRLAPRLSAVPAEYDALVNLTNGDMLPGSLVSMDDEILKINTWFAGMVNINRSMVMNIQPNISMADILFEGPNSLEEWTLSPHGGRSPQWRYSDGAMYSMTQYPAGRIIEDLPDKYEVRFEAAWRTSHPQFSFIFNSEDVQRNMDAYTLNVQGQSLSISRVTRNTGSRTVGTRVNYTGFGSDSGQRSAIFNLLVDKDTRSFTLLIDGVQAGQWTDPAEFAGPGNGIAFRSGSSGDLKISNIRIAHWNGQVPGVAESGGDPGEHDVLSFVNNDKFSGRVISIADGTIKFETSYATLDIPLAQVSGVAMADERAERARRNREDVRAVFVEQGSLTLKLERIEDSALLGETENFGRISVPLGVVRTLEWNLYRGQQDDETDDF